MRFSKTGDITSMLQLYWLLISHVEWLLLGRSRELTAKRFWKPSNHPSSYTSPCRQIPQKSAQRSRSLPREVHLYRERAGLWGWRSTRAFAFVYIRKVCYRLWYMLHICCEITERQLIISTCTSLHFLAGRWDLKYCVDPTASC